MKTKHPDTRWVVDTLQSDFWYLRVMAQGGDLVSALTPWPLHYLLPKAYFPHSNRALTGALIVAGLGALGHVSADAEFLRGVVMAEVATVLAIIALGASVEGANLFRMALRRDPKNVLALLSPYVWSVVTGALAVPATFFLATKGTAGVVALGVVAFAVLTSLQTILSALRMYGLGLLDMVVSDAKKDAPISQTPALADLQTPEPPPRDLLSPAPAQHGDPSPEPRRGEPELPERTP